jgi:hypothetical protein
LPSSQQWVACGFWLWKIRVVVTITRYILRSGQVYRFPSRISSTSGGGQIEGTKKLELI